MSWFKTAYVGQKIICIDDTTEPFYCINSETKPVKGNLYHIRGIVSFKNIICFYLKEIVNKPGWYGMPIPHIQEQFFDYWRFRPVQTNEKGMSMLRELLNPINHKVLEKV